jgi:hypothetical protein
MDRCLTMMLVVWLHSTLSASDWNLQIVPTRSDKNETFIYKACPSACSCFFVVLTNRSKLRKAVWMEECSWGYNILSFIVRLHDGSVYHVKKKPRLEWERNYPMPFYISPERSFVWSVKFSPDTWEGFPNDWWANEVVSITAKVEIPKDEKAESYGVWSGLVLSDPITTTLL